MNWVRVCLELSSSPFYLYLAFVNSWLISKHVNKLKSKKQGLYRTFFRQLMEWLAQAGGEHQLQSAQQQKREATIRAMASTAATATTLVTTTSTAALIAPVTATTRTVAAATGAGSAEVTLPILHNHQPVTIKKRGS